MSKADNSEKQLNSSSSKTSPSLPTEATSAKEPLGARVFKLLSKRVSFGKDETHQIEDSNKVPEESPELKALRESFERVYKGDDTLRHQFEMRAESKKMGMSLTKYYELYSLWNKTPSFFSQLLPSVTRAWKWITDTPIWKWTGISEKKGWDLLTGLSIPLVIFIGGLYFSNQNNERQQTIAEANREQDQRIADDKQKDETLRKYIDDMTTLFLDKDYPLIKSKKIDGIRSIARTKTLIVLKQIRDVKIDVQKNDDRRRLVIQFLSESELIKREDSIVDLSSADLRFVNLTSAELKNINLTNIDFSFADFRFAKLSDSDLGGANLRSADLNTTELNNINLTNTNLSNADLSNADLSSANLSGANLSGANLSNVTIRRKEQLSVAKLCNTLLPQGTGLDPNRDCIELKKTREE